MAGLHDYALPHAERREAAPDTPRRGPAPGAEAVLRLQRDAGNQAVLRALATLAREHKPTEEEREKYAGKNGWTNERLDELGLWSKSATQFAGIAEGLSYDHWAQDVRPAY